MLRIAYIAGSEIVPAKKQSKKDAFMADVAATLAAREMLDEARAKEMFKPELIELHKLRIKLHKLEQLKK